MVNGIEYVLVCFVRVFKVGGVWVNGDLEVCEGVENEVVKIVDILKNLIVDVFCKNFVSFFECLRVISSWGFFMKCFDIFDCVG